MSCITANLEVINFTAVCRPEFFKNDLPAMVHPRGLLMVRQLNIVKEIHIFCSLWMFLFQEVRISSLNAFCGRIFSLNGHTLEIYPRIQKLEPPHTA